VVADDRPHKRAAIGLAAPRDHWSRLCNIATGCDNSTMANTITNTATIDTAKCEHRTLRFQSIDEVLAEIDRIVAAEKAGKLRHTGNWTAGQIFNHLATWMNYSYEGFPKQAHPPWFVRLILKMKAKKYLRDGMPRAVKIPGIKEGTLATEPTSTQEGTAKLKAALHRLKNREPVKFDSPAFGRMSDETREQFQLRHAEGHFGYLCY
jgi:hypothetical protein